MDLTPTPKRLYIHDDLTPEVRDRHGAGSAADKLAAQLMAFVSRRRHVRILGLHEQIEALVTHEAHAPFALALGIGSAGERVAHQLHARIGWFPHVQRLELTREEDGRGGYTLVSPSGYPLAAQLAGVEAAATIALVDDTVFSGMTLRRVLESLTPAARAHSRAFCLRAVAQSLPALRTLCPVAAGFTASGRPLQDVSFINASGLVRRGAIRRTGLPPLAFFEREEWMRAWFPGCEADVVELCHRLELLLEYHDAAPLQHPRVVG